MSNNATSWWIPEVQVRPRFKFQVAFVGPRHLRSALRCTGPKALVSRSNPGRTMEYCLKMNQELGVTCILPDFFRGVDGRPDPVPAWDQLCKVPCLFINRWFDQIYWCWHQNSIPKLLTSGRLGGEAGAVPQVCWGSVGCCGKCALFVGWPSEKKLKKKRGGNLLWVIPWCPYVSQVDIKYFEFGPNPILLHRKN